MNAFELYRNMYKSILKIYLIFVELTVKERKRRFIDAMESGHSAPQRPVLSIFSKLYTNIDRTFQRVVLDESQNAKNISGPTFKAIASVYFDIDLTVVYNTDILPEHRYGLHDDSKRLYDYQRPNHIRPQLITADPIQKAASYGY